MSQPIQITRSSPDEGTTEVDERIPAGPGTPSPTTGRRSPGAFVRRGGTKVLHVLLLPALLIGVYAYASANSASYYTPTPDLIAEAFAELWFSERFFVDVLPSLGRLITGFTISAVLGVGLGVLLGLSTRVRAVLEPVLEFLRAIPPPVLVPLMILLVGIDNSMKVLVIVSGCVWPILLNTIEGVRAVDPVLADTARCYGITGTTRLRVLILRSASPQIMAGLRLGLALAIILMVISEMFASSSGLGFAIVQFQRTFAIPEMWAGMVLLGLVGFALSAVFELAENRVLAWYRGLRAANRGE